MRKKASEKLIEKKLREGVKKLGGMALKFTSPGTAGVPDRIVLMPGGKIYFVETKSEGKKLSTRQTLFSGKLEWLGHFFMVVYSESSLYHFLYHIKTEQEERQV